MPKNLHFLVILILIKFSFPIYFPLNYTAKKGDKSEWVKNKGRSSEGIKHKNPSKLGMGQRDFENTYRKICFVS